MWGCALAVLAAAWQLTTASDDVADAAGQAARAAALTAVPADAVQIAERTARDRLRVGACEPASVAVRVDVSDFRAGGRVEVSVSCRTDSPLGAARTVNSVGEEVIDRYRGGL